MQAIADTYFEGTLPRGLTEFLSQRYRAAALKLLRDVVTQACFETRKLGSGVMGDVEDEAADRGHGFVSMLSRIDEACEQEQQFLLLALIWISVPFATALGVSPSLWHEYELLSCGRAQKSRQSVKRIALHPIQLYHKFVLQQIRR